MYSYSSITCVSRASASAPRTEFYVKEGNAGRILDIFRVNKNNLHTVPKPQKLFHYHIPLRVNDDYGAAVFDVIANHPLKKLCFASS
jgi:hypothetical protein